MLVKMKKFTFLHIKLSTLISCFLIMTTTVCLFQTELRFIHDSPIQLEICVEIEMEEESEKEVETDEFVDNNNKNNMEINRLVNIVFLNTTCFISHHLNVDSPPPEFV